MAIDGYYTVEDLANSFDVAASTVRRWANCQRVPYVRLGNTILFPKKEFEEHLREIMVKPVGKAPRRGRRGRRKMIEEGKK